VIRLDRRRSRLFRGQRRCDVRSPRTRGREHHCVADGVEVRWGARFWPVGTGASAKPGLYTVGPCQPRPSRRGGPQASRYALFRVMRTRPSGRCSRRSCGAAAAARNAVAPRARKGPALRQPRLFHERFLIQPQPVAARLWPPRAEAALVAGDGPCHLDRGARSADLWCRASHTGNPGQEGCPTVLAFSLNSRPGGY